MGKYLIKINYFAQQLCNCNLFEKSNVIVNNYLFFKVIGPQFRIRPILEYDDAVWNNCSQYEKDKLETIQIQTARATRATKLI